MAENKRYFWLKLKEGFFGEKEVKKLRKIAGGDTYTIIYLKLMLLSLRDNGKLYYDGIEDTFYEELALDIDEDADNVKVTLIYLQKMGLMEEISPTESFLTQIPECVGSETQKAELMRKSRARKKALESGNNVTDLLPPVTNRYPDIDINTEINQDVDIEPEKRGRVDYEQIKDLYNDICISFPRLTVLSDNRKKAIKARLKTYSVEQFKQMFEMAEQSSFLKGANTRNWSANFDWLIKDANFAKVLEGNYNDHKDTFNPSTRSQPSGNVFLDLLQEGYE